MKKTRLDCRLLIAAGLLLLAVTVSPAAGDDSAAATSMGQEPSSAVSDPFPNACVDCHLSFPERGLDVRLSKILEAYREEASPKARLAAQRVASPHLRLQGRHPDVTGSMESIPEACLTCHGQNEPTAPPFAQLIHVLHLVGGEENHYVTEFQGDCRNCHKLDAAAGRLVVPSAGER